MAKPWQGHRILKSQHPRKVRLTERGAKALGFDAALTRFLAKEIARDVPDDGHMRWCVTAANTTDTLMKGYVQDPRHAMFDAPVSAYQIIDRCGRSDLVTLISIMPFAEGFRMPKPLILYADEATGNTSSRSS